MTVILELPNLALQPPAIFEAWKLSAVIALEFEVASVRIIEEDLNQH